MSPAGVELQQTVGLQHVVVLHRCSPHPAQVKNQFPPSFLGPPCTRGHLLRTSIHCRPNVSQPDCGKNVPRLGQTDSPHCERPQALEAESGQGSLVEEFYGCQAYHAVRASRHQWSAPLPQMCGRTVPTKLSHFHWHQVFHFLHRNKKLLRCGQTNSLRQPPGSVLWHGLPDVGSVCRWVQCGCDWKGSH